LAGCSTSSTGAPHEPTAAFRHKTGSWP
jgi:hypothetical protein